MVSTLNLNDMDGVVRVVRHASSAPSPWRGWRVILSLCLIPEFGFAQGTWHGIFHAVSSFCNAALICWEGVGAFSSLIGYNDNPVMLVTSRPHRSGRPGLLRVGGHSGQAVLEQAVGLQQDGAPHHRCADRGGALFFLMEEFDNPATLGDMPLWQKGLNALFQSVTLRTAGFDSIGQGGLSDTSKAMSCVLMLIGGSSGSTAGGLKTATVGVLLLALRSGLMGREQVTFRGRAIHYRRVLNAMTLALVVLFVFVFSSMVVSTVEDLPYLDSAFEVASAMGTVGLTTGITPTLTPFSQGLLILLMYMGRVGILSFSIAFITGNRHPAKIKYPEMNVMIG
ncbi:MAG: potassium transporter TrkG [Flavonifractor plautii]